MDSAEHHRASLPPLKLFEFDKNRREELDYQTRHANMTPVSTAPSAAPSPLYQYPTGPPPPYSHPAAPVQAAPTAPAGTRTPPEVRRLSSEDAGKDQAKQQSLPSIHEALGVEQPRSFSYSAAPQSYPTPVAAPPSPPPARRSFAMEPPPPRLNEASSFSSSRRSPGPQYRSEISPRSQQEPFERARPSYANAPPPPVLPQQRNGHYSPGHHPAPYPQSYPAPEPSPSAERTPSHTTSMPPPPTPFAYGYSSYPPRPSAYAGPPPAPYTAPATNSVYQPSATQPAPVHAESPRGASLDQGRSVYGESVKRHLDMYDLEAALNEIAQSSTYLLEFSRDVGARMHQTQRSGPVPGTLPSIHEIDDLMARSRGTIDSLGRMREVVAAQQAAYYQQAQEQQFKAQDEIKRDSVHQAEDSKVGGFAGPEAKKRRGRAAPPGRCHSCQRAETPEWRRGPDGARTLCNACGLHYAKLTRKQGAQKASIGSSNLRPKSDPADSKN